MSKETTTNSEIKSAIYHAFVLLGAQMDLLVSIGSWGDSMSDDDVLSGLRHWNEATLREIKGRIEHYETSGLHSADIPDADQEKLLAKQ